MDTFIVVKSLTRQAPSRSTTVMGPAKVSLLCWLPFDPVTSVTTWTLPNTGIWFSASSS